MELTPRVSNRKSAYNGVWHVVCVCLFVETLLPRRGPMLGSEATWVEGGEPGASGDSDASAEGLAPSEPGLFSPRKCNIPVLA